VPATQITAAAARKMATRATDGTGRAYPLGARASG
jgi:hypothetical protein